MTDAIPIGELVRPQPRGQVTIPKKLRKKLNLTKDTILNVFEDEGVIIMIPIKVVPKGKESYIDIEWEEAVEKTRKLMEKYTDWTADNFSVEKYMQAVRYNPLAKLRMKRMRERW